MDGISRIIKKYGYDKFNEVLNIATVAIEEDSFNIDNRLRFADGIKGFNFFSIEELVRVFVYAWDTSTLQDNRKG